MRYTANCITAARIPLSLALLFLAPLSIPFYICYSLCGLSDMLDGYCARKSGTQSRFGARLDSAADMTLVFVMLLRFFPLLAPPVWLYSWVAAIAAIRLCAWFIGYKKHRVFTPLHTLANKATGLLLFCFPYFYGSVGLAATAIPLCAAATFSAVEELLLQRRAQAPDPNVKSIFTLHAPY